MFEKLKEKRAKKRQQKLSECINSMSEAMSAFGELNKNMSDVFTQQFSKMMDDQAEQNDEGP